MWRAGFPPDVESGFTFGCKTHYIEKNYDSLYAGGAFPCGPQGALFPRELVAKYPASFKHIVVEGDVRYVSVEPEWWTDVS